MITTPLGPEFVKNDDQSGAKSGDHTHVVSADGIEMAAADGVITPTGRSRGTSGRSASSWTTRSHDTPFRYSNRSTPVVLAASW